MFFLALFKNSAVFWQSGWVYGRCDFIELYNAIDKYNTIQILLRRLFALEGSSAMLKLPKNPLVLTTSDLLGIEKKI